MKKLFSVLLVFVLMLSFAGCGGAQSSAASPEPSAAAASSSEESVATKKKIGLAMNALDEYQTEWLSISKAYMESKGYELIITNAEGKVDKQLADIESLIAQKPAAIVIRATDSEGIVPAFEACTAAGIPTLDAAYDANYKDTLKVNSSQKDLCALQAQYCDDWLKANPDKTLKVGYLWGVQGVSGTQDRYDGWKDPLMKSQGDRVEIVAEKVCNWSAVESMAAVEDWLQAYPEINCIVAQSDEMALAATNVLQAANIGLDKCIVVGIDGSENARVALKNGTLSATACISRKYDAEITMEYAIKIAEGEKLAGTVVNMGMEAFALMTAENMDEVIAKIG